MDRGGLDSLSFERGGRSADYAPASLRFFLLVALRFCACFCPCFASVGLRGGRADSLLCFELVTLRARRAGLRLLLLLASVAPLGSAIHSGWSSSAGRSSLRCSLLACSGCWAPRAARSRPSLVSFAPLASLAALSLAWLPGSPPWAGLASSARLGWLARLALALSYSRLLGRGNTPRLNA